MPPPEPRRFVRPWKAVQEGESWQVQDATGQPIAYLYFCEANDRRRETRRLTYDEARRIATNMARLPDLLDLAKRGGLERGE